MNDMSGLQSVVESRALSRRSFLIAAGGTSVAVAFAPLPEAFAATAASARAFQPNAWVVIAQDGTVTIMSPACEMGQGSMTALPMLIAEDLDADWRKVHVVQSPDDARIYGNPAFFGALTTVGSRAVLGYYEKLRLAGAQARQILLAAAAEAWKVPVGELTTEPGTVVHAASHRKIGYGELARIAQVPDPMPIVRAEDLKPLAQCRYIGKSLPRVDVAAKVDGTAKFGIDTELPNMLYAAVLHPPVQGETPEHIDDAVAKKIRGIVKIVALPHGVGIIGTTVEATKKAKDALTVTWSNTARGRNYSSDGIARDYLAIARDWQQPGVTMLQEGDAAAAIAGAAKVISADFVSAHISHACLEPMNATAIVTGDRVELWASSQSPSYMQQFCAAAAGTSEDKVTVHTPYVGGGYGRRTDGDEEIEVVLLAKTMPGRPIKLIWSREDDLTNDKFRPLSAQRVEIGLDAAGEIVGWRHRIVCESYFNRADPVLLKKFGGKDVVSAGGGNFSYAVPAHSVDWVRAPRGVDVGAWRGTASGYIKFAIETLIDELAAGKGVDPVAYRLALLQKEPRAVKVVETVAQMADWQAPRPQGRALGIAFSDSVALTAVVAEVSLDEKTGEIHVHHLWAASDPGIVLQPDNSAAQIEGAMVMGLGAALVEEITVENGVVQEANFDRYKLLRMSQVPPIEVKVISTDNKPGGIGEAGAPPVPPAIANAVARLTGKRLRQLPMSSKNVMAALKA